MAFSLLNANKFRAYTTVEGDRWDTIALKAYGDATKFDPIIQSNNGVPLSVYFTSGVTLRIPVIESVEETNKELLPPWKRTASASEQQAKAAVPAFINPSSTSAGSFDESFD
jgi:hypothetical protein